jgi:hypothetical protein
MGALDIAAAAAAKYFLECAVNFWAMPRLAVASQDKRKSS